MTRGRSRLGLLVLLLALFIVYAVRAVRLVPERPIVVAVLGPTATGKSALALALAERFGGEIINCDSTAVYRGFDIGTDKVPLRGAARHSASPDRHRRSDRRVHRGAVSRAMRRASIRDIHARGRLPILVGGTGFYYRALTRGLFPGPGRDEALRARLEAIADATRRTRFCIACCGGVDPPSAARIQPRDLKRMVRALEVFFLTGRPLTAHFADTVSPIADMRGDGRSRSGCRRRRLASASTRRVDEQFERGLLDEIRGLLARGVPETARPFGGLVYRQALEHLHGVRDEAATRALIAQENRRYARRQLIWFRKEPNLQWFDGPGESPHDHRRRAAGCSTSS